MLEKVNIQCINKISFHVADFEGSMAFYQEAEQGRKRPHPSEHRKVNSVSMHRRGWPSPRALSVRLRASVLTPSCSFSGPLLFLPEDLGAGVGFCLRGCGPSRKQVLSSRVG